MKTPHAKTAETAKSPTPTTPPMKLHNPKTQNRTIAEMLADQKAQRVTKAMDSLQQLIAAAPEESPLPQVEKLAPLRSANAEIGHAILQHFTHLPRYRWPGDGGQTAIRESDLASVLQLIAKLRAAGALKLDTPPGVNVQ